MFTVLTGKNGSGKSTLLHFIENLLYQTIIESHLEEEKAFLIEQRNGKNYNSKQTIENHKISSIPVLLKLHDFIVLKDEIINKIKEKFTNHGNLYDGLSILSVYNLDSSLNFLSNKLDILNQHLKKNAFKYTVSKEKDTFYFKYNLFKVTLKQLSPGEQLMLQLYIWKFVLTRFPFKHKFVLLLDEPDAHLHPKAVHDFIAILKKVCEAGAQIIMTTHSPTSVSFVDEKNLFLIRKYIQSNIENGFGYRIENDSKANIKNELTEDLVMVNLPFRVIYVEGKLDYDYYKWVKWSLSRKINFKSQILFEPLKKGENSKGGCHIIRYFLSTLVESLVFDHFGIVDNDNIHTIHEQIFGLSKQFSTNIDPKDSENKRRVLNIERYSIENYILDPIYFYFFLKTSSKSVNDSNFKDLQNNLVNHLVDFMQTNDYFNSDKLQDIVIDLIKVDMTLNDIYLDANDEKNFSSDKVKEKISELEKEFPKSYVNVCKHLMESIVKNMSYFLFDYLIKYNEINFSFRIFDGINEKQIAYKLIDLFCYLPNTDRINSVDFLFDILNDFDRMAKRFKEDLEKSKETDINILNPDKLKENVFQRPNLPILKNYFNVCEVFQNEQDQNKAKIDEFKRNLIKSGIVREILTVDRAKINALFNNSVETVTDKIENLIKCILNSKDKFNLKTSYSNLTALINLHTNKSFLENFEKDKIRAQNELKDYLIERKLYETKLMVDKSKENQLSFELNNVLNRTGNQYEEIEKFAINFFKEFNTNLDILNILKSKGKGKTIFKELNTLETIIEKDIGEAKIRIRDFVEQNSKKTDPDLIKLVNDIQLLEVVIGFLSTERTNSGNTNCYSFDELIAKLINKKFISERLEIDSTKFNAQQTTLQSSVENIVKLYSCHQKYPKMKSDFEILKSQFNLTPNDSIQEQLHKKLIENNLITQNLAIIEENLGDKSDFQKWKLKKYLKLYSDYKTNNQILKELKECSYCVAILFDIDVDFYQKPANNSDKYENFENYLKLKKGLDRELIGEIERQLLDESVKCYFVYSKEDVFIEYPKIFYRLQGHTLEYILQEIFLIKDNSSQSKKIKLSEQVLESIVLKSDRFIPHEMLEIFSTIDNDVDQRDYSTLDKRNNSPNNHQLK